MGIAGPRIRDIIKSGEEKFLAGLGLKKGGSPLKNPTTRTQVPDVESKNEVNVGDVPTKKAPQKKPGKDLRPYPGFEPSSAFGILD